MAKKSKYNPEIHHRRSIRLKEYDYSQPGAYFITICTHNRECLFGHIDNGAIILNDAGNVARKCWIDIPEHFPDARTDAFVIMPNHIHGIIIITECVSAGAGANNHSPLPLRNHSPLPLREHSSLQKKPGTSKTIGSIVRGFKIGVTKWFRENTHIYTPWQRNYYEHIIRNENQFNRIRRYIINNPINWESDKNFTK